MFHQQFLRLPSNYSHLYKSKLALKYSLSDNENKVKIIWKIGFICNSFYIQYSKNYKISSNDGPKPAQGKFHPSSYTIAQICFTIAYMILILHKWYKKVVNFAKMYLLQEYTHSPFFRFHWSHFSEKFLKILKNWKKKNFHSDTKGSPLEKKLKNWKKLIFSKKINLFTSDSEFYIF